MTEERAVLAGGCFWGVQDLIRRYDGVLSTRVGYTGGTNSHATYRNHPGHAEAVEIIFDPARITYRQILEFFFQIHDPSTRNRQGNDVGSSYRSAIFYTSEEQRRVAEDTIADVDASGLWPGKVVTEVRTISCDIPAAIRAISCGPTGDCRFARIRLRWRPEAEDCKYELLAAEIGAVLRSLRRLLSHRLSYERITSEIWDRAQRRLADK
jgi:peptide-methionine (S)-S-oxide reductase